MAASLIACVGNAPTPIDSDASDAVNTGMGELSPTVTANGRTLAFARSTVLGGGDYQLFITERSSPAQDFPTPNMISSVSSSNDTYPFLTPDGSELWFGSTRGGNYDIYVAEQVGQSFASPSARAELNTMYQENAPVLSSDGLTIYWTSARPDGNAKGGVDIWTAKRSTRAGAFSSIVNVSELNTPGEEVPSWLSADGCHLYFESDRNGSRDLFVAAKPQ